MTDEPTSYLGTITLKDYVPDTLTLTSSRGEAVFIITPDGMLNLGPAYKENPDAAAQEFIRIIMEMMPKAFAERAARLNALDEAQAKVERLEEALEELANEDFSSRMVRYLARIALKETGSFTDDPFNRAVLGLPPEPTRE